MPRQGPPSNAYQTYAIRQPAGTHFRPATCEEIDCPEFLNGWLTRVPIGSEHEHLITSGGTGRRYHEVTAIASAEREFLFDAGQPCFRASTHQVPLGKPATFLLKVGDGGPRVLPGADAWRDDMGEHLDKVREQRERG